jgi:hypothetical protein
MGCVMFSSQKESIYNYRQAKRNIRAASTEKTKDMRLGGAHGGEDGTLLGFDAV